MKNIRKLLFFLFLFTFSVIGVVRPPLLISPLDIDNQSIPIPEKAKEKEEKQKKSGDPTNWGGNSLTQEEKEIEGIKTKVYSLKGSAWILHKNVRLSAYSIEIVGQDALKGYLRGKVKVVDPEHNLKLTGANGVYDKLAETIVLKGRPTLYYTDKKNKTTKVSAPYIKRYMAESKTVLEKEVIVENPDYSIFGDSAVYYENDRIIELDNYPYFFGEEVFLTGRKGTYESESKRAVLEEDTILMKLSMENKKEKKNKNSKKQEEKKTNEEKQRIVSVFTGDKLIHETDPKGGKSVGMYGNAHLVRPDVIFDASYIKAFGENLREIEAKESVTFLDLEDHIRLTGNTLEHSEESGYTHITDEPIVEFLNKDHSKVEATMTSTEIERFQDKKEIVARGNVTVKTQNAVLLGEYATYFEEKEFMELKGNPRMIKDENMVRSGKIVLFPSENRILLTDGIKSN